MQVAWRPRHNEILWIARLRLLCKGCITFDVPAARDVFGAVCEVFVTGGQALDLRDHPASAAAAAAGRAFGKQMPNRSVGFDGVQVILRYAALITRSSYVLAFELSKDEEGERSAGSS